MTMMIRMMLIVMETIMLVMIMTMTTLGWWSGAQEARETTPLLPWLAGHGYVLKQKEAKKRSYNVGDIIIGIVFGGIFSIPLLLRPPH